MRTVIVPVIQTNADLDAALARIEQLMRSGAEDVEDEIRILGLIIRDFESEYIRFRQPDPVEVLRFILSERGMDDSQLAPYIGSEAAVNDVLERRQPLTLEMVRLLVDGLGIPVAALVGSADRAAA